MVILRYAVYFILVVFNFILQRENGDAEPCRDQKLKYRLLTHFLKQFWPREAEREEGRRRFPGLYQLSLCLFIRRTKAFSAVGVPPDSISHG